MKPHETQHTTTNPVKKTISPYTYALLNCALGKKEKKTWDMQQDIATDCKVVVGGSM